MRLPGDDFKKKNETKKKTKKKKKNIKKKKDVYSTRCLVRRTTSKAYTRPI